MTPKYRSGEPPRTVSQVMADSDTGFARILQRAQALERLNAKVVRLLDDDLARHCQVANLRDGMLIFACTSPGCATRLRMQAPQLLEQLRAAGIRDVDEIAVKMMI